MRHNDGRDLINVDSFIRFELVQSLIDELDNRNGSQFRCMIGLHITHYFFSRLIATVLYSTSDYSTTVSPEVLQHADVTTGTHLDLRIYPLAQTSDGGAGLQACTCRYTKTKDKTRCKDKQIYLTLLVVSLVSVRSLFRTTFNRVGLMYKFLNPNPNQKLQSISTRSPIIIIIGEGRNTVLYVE